MAGAWAVRGGDVQGRVLTEAWGGTVEEELEEEEAEEAEEGGRRAWETDGRRSAQRGGSAACVGTGPAALSD